MASGVRLSVFALLLFVLFIGCSRDAGSKTDGLDQLSVTWALVGNQPDETCIASFRFFNGGSSVIRKGKWSLYFNQNTLHPAAMPDAGRGKVEHVNGDLYRFIPGDAFELAPGDSLTVRYTYRGMLIKMSDVPAGAYFVSGDGTANERIVMPSAFTVTPMEKPEILFLDPAVLSTIPTAASEYARNLHIQPLPVEQVGRIIPSPARFIPRPGKATLSKSATVSFAKGLESEARYLAATLNKVFGFTVRTEEGPASQFPAIELDTGRVTVSGISAETYQLTVSADKGIRILGADAAGVFYGIQSLLSLAWSEKDGESVFKVPCAEILDAPRFGYRGFLLDVSRNFHKKEDVLRLIDLLSMYKVNKLNIRISDDEGWRLEINGLPELTAVGGKRGHTRDSKNWLMPSFGSGPFPDAPGNHGAGYYTREDFKEIIRYASQRHIEVIPEVCLPSHARAAIKAMEARYDYYLARNEPGKAQEFRLVDPDDRSVYLSAQMYKDNIVCVALPSVYHFYETVVKDLVAMYDEAGLKLRIFNTGGDEVPKGAWARSPLCARLMQTLPEIADSRQLQGYFLGKAMEIFDKYRLKVSGWEEIVLNKDGNGKVAVNHKFTGRDILPLVWDNTDDNIDLGYRIANAGYPVVLCNVTNLYFDLAYNTDPSEPGLYWGGFQDAIDPFVMSPFDVYKSANFDMFSRLYSSVAEFPGKQRLKAQFRRNIIGLQAQLWSETVKGPAMLEYYVVPKIFAFAEKAWAQAPAWEEEPDVTKRNAALWKDWSEFSNRIGRYELGKIDRYFGSYHYRIAPPGAVIDNGTLKANISFPGLAIRYTTDGTEPQAGSTEYSSPVKVAGNVKIRAFNQSGRGSRTFRVGQ